MECGSGFFLADILGQSSKHSQLQEGAIVGPFVHGWRAMFVSSLIKALCIMA